MANFDDIVGAIQNGFEAVIADSHLCARKKCHNCTFSHSGISNNNDGFITVGILGDAGDAVFDHLAYFDEIEGILHLNSIQTQL